MLTRILIYTALALLFAPAAHADAVTVLIFPFENQSTERNLDWIGEGIAELVIERLQSEPALAVFSREERLAAFEKLGIPESAMVSRATALKLGWDCGADVVITGRFSGTAERFEITARLVDMELGRASEDIKAQGKLEDVIPLVTTMARGVLSRIAPGNASPETDYTTQPPTPRSAFENYVRGLLNPDFQKRGELLRTAVRLYPQYGSALFQLGRAYHLERDFKSSNQWLSRVSEQSQHRLQARFLMGLNYFYLADYSRAIAAFQGLPQTYDVLLNLGAAQLQKGDTAGAVSTWRRAAEMDPLVSEPPFNAGYASFLKGDWDGAVKNFTESLRLRGRDSEALYLLGRAYDKQGRTEESQRMLAQASRLSQRVERWNTQPMPKLERLAASTAFRGRDEIWTDRRLARRARAQDPAMWLDLAQNQLDLHFYGEAIRELQYVLRVFPGSAEARSLLDEVNERRNVR